MSGRQKILSTMIIHVLHFKFEFEFLESMENAFNKMIEKLLNRNNNAKQKASRFSKRSADKARSFETYYYKFRNIPLWKWGFETLTYKFRNIVQNLVWKQIHCKNVSKYTRKTRKPFQKRFRNMHWNMTNFSETFTWKQNPKHVCITGYLHFFSLSKCPHFILFIFYLHLL